MPHRKLSLRWAKSCILFSMKPTPKNLCHCLIFIITVVFITHTSAASTKFDPKPNDDRARISFIDATGVFGEELTLKSFKAAVLRAITDKVDYLVFVLDSPGGDLRDAKLIAELLSSAPASLTIASYVIDALSASVFVLATSDSILVSPKSATGAAVAYTYDSSTGEYDVDKKFNSAIAAQVASLAENNNQSGAIYRAMIDPGASLWTYLDENGHLHYQQNEPNHDSKKMWDSPETVLTLTPNESQEIGLATLCPNSKTAIAKKLGHDEFVLVKGPAYRFLATSKAVRRDQQKLAQFDATIDKTIAEAMNDYHKIVNRLDKSRSEDPRSMSVWYDRQSLMLTPSSQYKWIDQVKTYSSSLYSLQSHITTAAKREKTIQKLIAQRNDLNRELSGDLGYDYVTVYESWLYQPELKIKMETAWEESVESIRWCEQNKTRYTVDPTQP